MPCKTILLRWTPTRGNKITVVVAALAMKPMPLLLKEIGLHPMSLALHERAGALLGTVWWRTL